MFIAIVMKMTVILAFVKNVYHFPYCTKKCQRMGSHSDKNIKDKQIFVKLSHHVKDDIYGII